MLAPALVRSQMLSLLYQAVHRGEMTKKDAGRRLGYVQGMRIRLQEDHFLQKAAWEVADQPGWSDTFDAEYVARASPQEGFRSARFGGATVMVKLAHERLICVWGERRAEVFLWPGR